MAMENFQCSMKLVHCLCLSQIFTNDRDSISFKIFGHDVSFTLEDFHIMCGLRITTHNIEKPINRESNILKWYFGKSKGVTLKDIRSFMTRNEITKNVVNHVHVCESDDDDVKLMEILVVESILFGKNTKSCVMEEYASIIEDDKVCAEYPWGNVAYEKLIYSLKHALDKQNKLHTTEYKLGGFPYLLCVWFYERFPDVRESTHERYRDFRVLDIIPTEEELNSMPLIHSKVVNTVPSTGESPRTLSRSKEANRIPVIGESPRSRSRSKEPNQTPFIGKSSRTQSRSTRSTSDFDDNELLETICSRLTAEVQRHAEKERCTIVNEFFDKFKKDERSAIVDAVFVKMKEYFDEKFEQLFKIVNKSNEMDDDNFDLSNHREYDRVIDCYEPPSDINDASDKVADVNATHEEATFEGDQHIQNQVEEHAAHDPSRKVVDDNATRKEATGECDEHVQQQGADDQVVGTEKHASSCSLESDIGQGNLFDGVLAICKEILGGDTQEIVTTVEFETSCASIDTTQKVSDDAELNEGRVEKNLLENTPMLLYVGAQLNEAGNANIEKERLEAAQKEFDTGRSKGKGNGSVGMQTPSVSQHLNQISSDASQLLPNPKRRKIFSSFMCDTSDIPNFNLCSFSLGSTQGTDSESNSAAVVVREERQECREQ
ncbi:uncharacterized protein [Nicotiana sylvestris]|uniref:uncharacterized protein n=1 Tax=Nicotiana sylvestris TaxID=4096 RepID=UPI00388C6B2A